MTHRRGGFTASTPSSSAAYSSPAPFPGATQPRRFPDYRDPIKPSHGGLRRRSLFQSCLHVLYLWNSVADVVAVIFLLVDLIFIFYIWRHLNMPYLCSRDESRTLRCPHGKDLDSLWQNPTSATSSWKACAEQHKNELSSLHPENETTGYILVHAEGGLNQQRISICNAVAVAKLLNATLILPAFKQDSIWKDEMKFEDVYDVKHFIDYLKDEVRIIRDVPDWSVIKNIPKFASAQFYFDNVLPRIKEKKVMSLKPFTDRLGYDNVPEEINRLRCKVNYHALKFLPEVEHMADTLVSRMRNLTGSPKPFIALHLRYEKGMVGLSFCDFVGTRKEKAAMDTYRLSQWPRRYGDGSHLRKLALKKRKAGRCPLEPGEVATILRGLGYSNETQIYVASGNVYGGENKMAPLRIMFPHLVTKENLATTVELDRFRNHISNLAALDFLVCVKSDVFMMTHGGNFAKLVMGARRYSGHRQKSIKPAKGHMFRILGDPYIGLAKFTGEIQTAHRGRTGLPEKTFPHYDIWENPLTPCMCRD